MSPVGQTARALKEDLFATCDTNDTGEVGFADDATDGCLESRSPSPKPTGDRLADHSWSGGAASGLGQSHTRRWIQPSGPHSTLFSMNGVGIRRIRWPSAVKIAMSDGPLPKSSEAEKCRPSGEKHGWKTPTYFPGASA